VCVVRFATDEDNKGISSQLTPTLTTTAVSAEYHRAMKEVNSGLLL